MIHLNKFLSRIKENSAILKTPDVILSIGLNQTDIKKLKKIALENQLITTNRNELFLTEKGLKYLEEHPLTNWSNKEFSLRPQINIEYLKEEKMPSVLTRSIRQIVKYYIENQPIKEFSLESALLEDIQNCEKLIKTIEKDILSKKRIYLDTIYNKYLEKGLTKSLMSLVLIKIFTENLDKIAFYEKQQFQLKFDSLMFDRIMAVPENFEVQRTEMEDEYILKDISKIILNKKSNNILEITKGLYSSIKCLDKYTMNTENLSPKTLRLRNVIVNAKDPISLFERDIPRALAHKSLQECDREFLNELKLSINELKNCTDKLIKNLSKFLLKSFHANSKEELSERFSAIKEYLGNKELKILMNNVIETDVSDDLWINRIATFINKSRVPKDWSDEDLADFKIKTKELALKFFVIESTVGVSEKSVGKKYEKVLKEYLELAKHEQLILLKNVIRIN